MFKELERIGGTELQIFEMNDSKTMETFQLNYLTLEGLSALTLVWEMNCQGIVMFRNLRRVSVKRL